MDIQEIITKLDNRTLAPQEWTHANHLRVALWYALSEPTMYDALHKTKCTLVRYNDSIARCAMKYHETKTTFWVRQVAIFAEKNPGLSYGELEAIILESPLTDNKYVLEFYSQELLDSPKARATYVEPDLKNF